MHDPDVMVFAIRRPWPKRTKGPHLHRSKRWHLRGVFWQVAGREFYWPSLIDVWHHEPAGHDSGTLCKGMGGSDLTWRNIKWATRHWRHISVTVRPVRRVRCWLTDHCAECGCRFLWKQGRTGYMSSDDVYHYPCMSLQHVRGQLEDAAKALTFTADQTERWRVEYWLSNREALTDQHKEAERG